MGLPASFLPHNVTLATGSALLVRRLDTLAAGPSPLPLGGNLSNASPIVRLDDSSFAEFVVATNGTVYAVEPEVPRMAWSRSLRRGTCPSDSLSAAPVVHLNRLASESFRRRFNQDLVYVGTHYESCAASTTTNKVYALRASDGAIQWTFNEAEQFSMDAVSGMALTGVRQEDMLFVTTKRTFSWTQHSVWAIDVTTGVLRWSREAGNIHVAPVLSAVASDRLYVMTLTGELKALSKTDGADIWRLDLHRLVSLRGLSGFRRPITIWSGDPGGALLAVVDAIGKVWLAQDNGLTARLLWTSPLPVKAGPTIFDDAGNLYVGGSDGTIYQLDTLAGSVLASRTVDSDRTARITDLSFAPAANGQPKALLSCSSEGHVTKHRLPFPLNSFTPSTPNTVRIV
jgi:outer membrane protein assembly factor BamB